MQLLAVPIHERQKDETAKIIIQSSKSIIQCTSTSTTYSEVTLYCVLIGEDYYSSLYFLKEVSHPSQKKCRQPSDIYITYLAVSFIVGFVSDLSKASTKQSQISLSAKKYIHRGRHHERGSVYARCRRHRDGGQ